jgi:hypothetical protein
MFPLLLNFQNEGNLICKIFKIKVPLYVKFSKLGYPYKKFNLKKMIKTNLQTLDSKL